MRYAAIALAFLLSACATGPDRRAFLNTLIGQPETEVVRVLGVPSRTYETQGHKFLAYIEQRQDIVGGGPFFAGGGFYGGGFYGGGLFGPRFGYGGYWPADVVQRVCETTLDLVAGRVQTWSLRGNACL